MPSPTAVIGRRARRRTVAAGFVAAALVAGCSSPGVTAVRSGTATPEFDRAAPPAPVTALPPAAPIAWGPCEDQPAPWECGTLTVPLDYRRPLDLGTVEIAVTRLAAADPSSRIGSLVVNPGGPGASGVELAWGEADRLDTGLTDRFDLVGFDPRGVGRSTDVDCGDLHRSFRIVLRTCLERSGGLLPYIGTQNAARDMDQLRAALGDERLTYLGFSYGTALGAVYADLFPDNVRALVLDGSVDPTAGSYNAAGEREGGFDDPFYGVQDFGGTLQVFLELCDATPRCPAGDDSGRLLDRVEASVGAAHTDHFDDYTKIITAGQVDGIITSAMYSTDLWPALALALADADDGDASMFAALGSFLEAGYPRAENVYDNLTEANVAIYCADFAGRSGTYAIDGCAGWPETVEPLPAITAVDTPTPIVVIGTDGDPATPGFLAPQMARALGDAVAIRWEGAGHTAFGHSECIDRMVVDYLVDLVVPRDQARCGFTDAVDTTTARAEQVFTLNKDRFRTRLTSVFQEEGLTADDAACVAEGIVADGSDTVLLYARMGVQRDEYLRLREQVSTSCGVTSS